MKLATISKNVQDVVVGSKVRFSEYPGTHIVKEIEHSPIYPGGVCFKMENSKGKPVHFNDEVMKQHFERTIE